MEKTEFLCIVAMVALMAAFAVLLVKKWGIAEWMQVHGDKYMSRLFSCDLCMSFWAGVIISVIAVLFMDDCAYIFIPVLSTPITRMLV